MYQYIYLLCKCNAACEIVKLDFCYRCLMTAETLEFESDVTGPTNSLFWLKISFLCAISY